MIVVPVSDLDRAKGLYANKLGFDVDHDTRIGDSVRIIRLTPPGSGCPVVIGTGMPQADDGKEPAPGTYQGMQLCVPDIAAARAELVGRGVDVTPVRHIEDGKWVDGPGGTWSSFVSFSDPDGDGRVIQEAPDRH
ncbi:VOC family protein [Streptomyces sannanensis]|uniref:VOC family protein n=1 Tax=Streptomyces sannanensis TaxID=285536 RepID=A0ABP6S993_9ACTN